MAKAPKQKRQIVARDINSWAAAIVEATTGEKVPADLVEQEIRKIAEERLAQAKGEQPSKNPAAVALGRLGGLKGGKARAEVLSAKERSAIASKAVKARWKRTKEIQKLTERSYSAKEIAARMGISVDTVTRISKSFSRSEQRTA